ncbi:MAG: hypothetical protein V1809_09005 [Planctomycetota bacterium]
MLLLKRFRDVSWLVWVFALISVFVSWREGFFSSRGFDILRYHGVWNVQAMILYSELAGYAIPIVAIAGLVYIIRIAFVVREEDSGLMTGKIR